MKRLSDLPPRDIELLSAYIDRDLTPRQEKKLLVRLDGEADLRWALDELRRTVSVLRSLPEVRPPRAYTLSPEAYGARPRAPAYPVLQLATALASLAFFAVVGLDTLTHQGRSAALAPAAQEPVERLAATAPEATSEAAAAEAQPFLGEAQPQEAPQALTSTPTPFPTEEGIGGGGPPVALPAASEALPTMQPGEAAEDRASIGPGTPCIGCGGGEPEAGEPTIVVEAPLQAVATPSEAATAAPAEKSPPPGEAIGAPTGITQAPAQYRPGIGLLRLAEVSLGLAAVIMAGLTLWVRRRG